MTYQTQLRPWCIVRQLPEMPSTIIDRFRRYHDADARVQFLRRQTPSQRFTVVFETEKNVASEPAH